MSRFLENEREKERERERERNPRAIKRSYGELGQFLDWPEPVQERRNERNRREETVAYYSRSDVVRAERNCAYFCRICAVAHRNGRCPIVSLRAA